MYLFWKYITPDLVHGPLFKELYILYNLTGQKRYVTELK